AADGGRCITDAVRETYALVNSARALAGLKAKSGPRFHFTLPGSVQGFTVEKSPNGEDVAQVGNEAERLCITLNNATDGLPIRIGTPTFVPPDAIGMGGYSVVASPTLYSGQRVEAKLTASDDLTAPLSAAVFVRVYETKDKLVVLAGPRQTLEPGKEIRYVW